MHKDGRQGTFDKIWKDQNTYKIMFNFRAIDEDERRVLPGKRGGLLQNFIHLDLPSIAFKRLQHWIAEEALNPVVKAEYSLPLLNGSDVNLVGLWSQPKQMNLEGRSIIENDGRNWDYGRLLSARSAEKVAVDFYRNYGRQVRDISITQIDENPPSNWKSYDLDIDNGSEFVDVKNARKSQNSENRYSEYCVPEFKHGRENKDVIIAGVFSPYLYAHKILQPTDYSKKHHITLLGETSLTKLEELREEFDALFGFSIGKHGIHAFLPPWVFEYPHYVYTERKKALNDFKSLSEAARSTNTPVMRSVVAAALASASDLSMALDHNTWNPWERTFVCQLSERIGKFGLSLPIVFLSVLAHFLDMASSSRPDSDFKPGKYRQLLFWGENSRPLGIYDPLNTIDALVKALNTLWTADNGVIRRFNRFKLVTFNILKGKADDDDSVRGWTTLIAYCGGRMPDGSACGKNPLILGASELCEHRYLICPKCGFCCIACDNKGASHELAESESPDGFTYF